MNQDAELIYELPEARSDLGLSEQRGLIACDFVFGNTESWKLCQPCPSEHVYFGEVGFGEGTQKHGAPKNTDPGLSTNLGRPLELKTPLLNPRALQQCCRKHGRLMSRSPVDAALNTTAPEITISAEPDSNFPEHAFTLSEECAGEAVIDTGASRTVVGGDRVQELVQVLSPFLKSPIKRVSSAVNFRFGNSGTLQSQYALCIPRRQKGWIRVEVVPGRTPFLVSNAILKELGVLVDPRNQVLRFLDRAGTIPLKTCRKNLLCVSVRDLLNIEDIHNTHHDTEEIYQHELEKQRAKLRRNAKHPSQEFSQSMHAFPVQKPLPSDFIQHGTAKLSAQTDWPPVISVTSTATDGQGHLHQPERYVVPGTESLRRRRSGSPDAEDLHDITEPELQCSSGDSEPPAMGKPCHSLRQEPGQELQPSVRDGQKLCLSDQKSKGSLVLASQLSELHDCPGEVRDEEPGTCATGDSQLCHLDSTAQRKSSTESSPEAGKDGRLAGDFRCRDHEEGEEQASQRTEQDGQQLDDADRPQPRESENAANADRSAPKRACTRDSGSNRRGGRATSQLISQDQLRMLQQKMDVLVGEIENNLEQIKKKHPSIVRAPLKSEKLTPSRPVDLLEVYCEPNSQLTQQVTKLGGCALRFTIQDGDLRTSEGINKLWMWVHMYEPRNIWVAPECKFWGSFSRFNMGRSQETQTSILQGRQNDEIHLDLCNQLYLHQVAMGRHFHLEQPRGSEMVLQPRLQETIMGTLPAFFDMCQAGRLKAPNVDKFLKKRTQVLTTSRIVHAQLHNVNCQGTHEHEPIKGNFKHPQHGWSKISAYAAAYTAIFARRVAKGMMWSRVCEEDPLLLDELLVGEEVPSKGVKRQMAQEVLELRRVHRRRHETKSPPNPGELETHSPQWQVFWKSVFAEFERDIPRVGNVYFHAPDPRVLRIQQQFPQVDLKFVLMCKGTERHRVPAPEHARDEIPLRKTLLVCRSTGNIRDLGNFEEWQHLSKAKQVRKSGPARVSMSVFGKRSLIGGSSGSHGISPEESDAPMEPQEDPGAPSSMNVPAESQVEKTDNTWSKEFGELRNSWMATEIHPSAWSCISLIGARAEGRFKKVAPKFGTSRSGKTPSAPDRSRCRSCSNCRCSRDAV